MIDTTQEFTKHDVVEGACISTSLIFDPFFPRFNVPSHMEKPRKILKNGRQL